MSQHFERLASRLDDAVALLLGVAVGGGVALLYDGPYELAPVALALLATMAGARHLRGRL